MIEPDNESCRAFVFLDVVATELDLAMDLDLDLAMAAELKSNEPGLPVRAVEMQFAARFTATK